VKLVVIVQCIYSQAYARVCARCLYPAAQSEVVVVNRKFSNICDAVGPLYDVCELTRRFLLPTSNDI